MSATRVKDGRQWPIGDAGDVAWIEQAVDFSKPVITMVPPGFAAYCRLELPSRWLSCALAAHDRAVGDVLRGAPGARQPWWLGYLDFCWPIDLVFNDAPRAKLFGWEFVLVKAGLEQALLWRADSAYTGAFAKLTWAWKGALPDLIFPEDRSWMLFTPWDDHWSDIGGPEELIDRFIDHPQLGARTSRLPSPEKAG